MVVARIQIAWISFSPEFPEVISESEYNYYKQSKLKKFVTIRFDFWKVFFIELIIILLGILSLADDSYHFFSHRGAGGEILVLLEGLFVILTIGILLSFVPSALSFVSAYFHSKKYINSLNKELSEKGSYISFCKKMGEIDKRYIMQIQRIKT